MTKLYFTKRFTKGICKGLHIHESLTFVSVERAADWIKGVKRNSARGKLPYELADYSFQNYVR